MKCPHCKIKVHVSEGHTSYSVSKHAWCHQCGSYYTGGMNKSTRQHYGHWRKPSQKNLSKQQNNVDT